MRSRILPHGFFVRSTFRIDVSSGLRFGNLSDRRVLVFAGDAFDSVYRGHYRGRGLSTRRFTCAGCQRRVYVIL